METLLKRINRLGFTSYNFEDVEIGEHLGEGGFGEVLKCHIKNKLFAAKRLFFEYDRTFENFTQNLLNEFKLCRLLKDCKYFTQIYGYTFDKEHDELYIIMEYLPCGSFDDYNKKCVFTIQEKLKIMSSLALALKNLHKHDLIHCDLKLDNFSYHNRVKNPYVKLFDYNFMIKGKSDENKTVLGEAVTKGYCSPESFSDEEKVCKKSDIYSFGVIFLELMLGYELWKNSDDIFRASKSINKELKYFKKNNTEIGNIIEMCLTENIEERYNASSLHRAINKLII